MSLKFPFKFKHSSHSYVFTASGSGDSDKVIDITWNDSSGVEHWVTYDLLEVLNLIDTGEWFVIAEETTSPIVEITQDEYTNLIEEINLLQDLLAEANNRIVELEAKSKFKPIKDMTYNDWVVACREGQEFKTRGGEIVTVIEMDDEGTIWPVRTIEGWHQLDGTFQRTYEVPEDIIERIS
jgi:hypothetical protein